VTVEHLEYLLASSSCPYSWNHLCRPCHSSQSVLPPARCSRLLWSPLFSVFASGSCKRRVLFLATSFLTPFPRFLFDLSHVVFFPFSPTGDFFGLAFFPLSRDLLVVPAYIGLSSLRRITAFPLPFCVAFLLHEPGSFFSENSAAEDVPYVLVS